MRRNIYGVMVLLPITSATAFAAPLSLDESCMIPVLNQTTQAQSNDTWPMDNIPSFMGQVRAHTNCLCGGTTHSDSNASLEIVDKFSSEPNFQSAYYTSDPQPWP